MTSNTWLKRRYNDPERMFQYLRKRYHLGLHGWRSSILRSEWLDRKFRLFLYAVWEPFLRLYPHDPVTTFDMPDRMKDVVAQLKDNNLEKLREQAYAFSADYCRCPLLGLNSHLTARESYLTIKTGLRQRIEERYYRLRDSMEPLVISCKEQVHVLREIFGDVCHPEYQGLCPTCAGAGTYGERRLYDWNTSGRSPETCHPCHGTGQMPNFSLPVSQDVRNIAKSIWQEEDFRSMPHLADALMDAGCDNLSILEHLRSREQHHLGCWALDVVLRFF